VLAVALAAAAGVGGFAVLGSDDGPRAKAPRAAIEAVAGPESAPFRLVFPKRWDVREKATAASRAGSPLVSLRRQDGTGALSLRVGGPLEGSLERLRSGVAREIRRSVPGARVTSSRMVRVLSGEALLTLWIDRGTGRVRSNLVVPDGERSYVLDAVVPGGADDAAREVGAIFSSFRSTAAP
jgi:hypothetical protein